MVNVRTFALNFAKNIFIIIIIYNFAAEISSTFYLFT